MATTRKQRLDVGRAVYEHRITKYEAARQNHTGPGNFTNVGYISQPFLNSWGVYAYYVNFIPVSVE